MKVILRCFQVNKLRMRFSKALLHADAKKVLNEIYHVRSVLARRRLKISLPP